MLLFLNNDVEARSDGWLAAMLGHAQRDEVGAVGALLRYPDLTVQHAGIVLGMSCGAAHVQQDLPFGRPSYLLMTDLDAQLHGRHGRVHDDPAVVLRGARRLRRRASRRLQRRRLLPAAAEPGQLVVYTPLAELIHHESKSRGHTDDAREKPFFRERWHDEILGGDPYYNRNLTHFDPYCRLSTEEERDLWSIFRSMLDASSTS